MGNDVLNELTRIKFTGQDFETYENEAKDFLKTYYPNEFNDYVNNNLGVALLQTIAWPSQNLAFYINQRTSNLYLAESTNSTAISRLARMLNYDIQPAIPFKVEVTINLSDGPYSFPVKIERGFRFNGPQGLIYEYRQSNPVIFAPGETQKTFEVEEGFTTRNVFISTGLQNQVFTLAGIEEGSYIANESFEVYVGPELWTEQRRITFDANPIYEVNYFSNPPEIRFGDGVAGLVPPANEELQVNFVITKGIQGAIASNEITGAADPLVVQNTNITIAIISSTEATGGDDPEDFRKVKIQAPEFFQSQNRAITKRDYDAIINTFPGIAKGDAQIIRSIDQDIVLNNYLDSYVDAVSGCSLDIQNNVNTITQDLRAYLGSILVDTCSSNTVQVSILAKNGNNHYAPSTAQLREDLRVHLEEINDIVHVVSVVDGFFKIVEVEIEIDILVNFNRVEDDVIENARLALEKSDVEPFGILILREYGQSLYLSDLYKAIRDGQENDDDIEYMNIKIVGPVSKLDSDGNLIVSAEAQEIVQAGTITIRTIQRTTGI
jgi:hypothetical protein